MVADNSLMITMRPAEPRDAEAIAELATAAFGTPEEAVIIASLEADKSIWLHAVAELDGRIVGQIIFYHLPVLGRLSALGLGPMCVDPWVQRQRIGMSLIRYGIDAAQRAGVPIIFVLGHADYYPKMGFSAEAAKDFQSPWTGMPEFMAIRLKYGPPMSGKLIFPKAFGVS
jgi:putative acetyltransferase